MISLDPASNSEWKNGATLIIWMTRPKVVTENVISQVSERISEQFRFLVIILAPFVQMNNVAPFFQSEFDAGSNEIIFNRIRPQPDKIRFFRIITRKSYLINFLICAKPF